MTPIRSNDISDDRSTSISLPIKTIIMKRYILFVGILVATLSAQAQVLKLANGDTISLKEKNVTLIIPQNNDLTFYGNEQFTYNIKDIKCIEFAKSATDIDAIGTDEIAIVFDNNTVSVINGDENAPIELFDDKGILVKRAKGNSVAVGDLADGLYIVRYNRKQTAKILKK